MSDRYFCDTNILIYLFSSDCPKKRTVVEDVLRQAGDLYISIQVVNECVRVLHERKKKSYSEIIKVIEELSEIFFINPMSLKTVKRSLGLANTYKYSYFDSLILSSALESQCSIMLTEDMHDNQLIEKTLRIINPFKNSIPE